MQKIKTCNILIFSYNQLLLFKEIIRAQVHLVDHVS